MNDYWYMAGTENTGEYIVVLRTSFGRVGYRELGASYRIRVEPEPAGCGPLTRLLTRSCGWKQPGDQGQDRYSIEVPAGQLRDVLRSAIRALGPSERGTVVNPSIPEWVREIVEIVKEEDRKPLRSQVFLSYSRKDAKWLERLQVHLKPLERAGKIECWDDTRIKPGARWREEIGHALASAKVAVLLVSADFLASDFIATKELPSLLAAAEAEGAVILPLIVSPCLFSSTPLARFQAVNPPDKPLLKLPHAEREKYFARLAKAIEAEAAAE